MLLRKFLINKVVLRIAVRRQMKQPHLYLLWRTISQMSEYTGTGLNVAWYDTM